MLLKLRVLYQGLEADFQNHHPEPERNEHDRVQVETCGLEPLQASRCQFEGYQKFYFRKKVYIYKTIMSL